MAGSDASHGPRTPRPPTGDKPAAGGYPSPDTSSDTARDGAQDTAPARFDPSRCPLCGEPNTCAMETERATGQPQPPCWCTQVDFSAELLARVPAQARRAACLCARCAASAPTASSKG